MKIKDAFVREAEGRTVIAKIKNLLEEKHGCKFSFEKRGSVKKIILNSKKSRHFAYYSEDEELGLLTVIREFCNKHHITNFDRCFQHHN